MPKIRKKRGLTIWRGPDGNWYWHLVATNGRIVAVGGEGYRRKGGALRGVQATLRLLMSDIWP